MLSYKQYLLEKRRNPEQNPKVSSYDSLKKYFGKDNIYFSMRSINKIGINPNSTYNTPNGIYSYWLTPYQDKLERTKSVKKTVPFMQDQPFIYIFKPKEDANIINLGDMTEDQSIELMAKVLDLKDSYRVEFLNMFSRVIDRIKETERIMYYIDNILKAKTFDDMMDYINLRTEEQVYYFSGVISTFKEQEPNNEKDKMKYYQDQFGKLLLRQEQKKRDLKMTIPSFSDSKQLAAVVYRKKGTEQAKVNTPGGIFWWLTWLLTGEGKQPNQWNKIFRDIGIDGCNDNRGQSIIHISEPFQCVFFDKTKLEVLQVVDNKDYEDIWMFKGEKYKKNIVNGVQVFDYLCLSFMELKSLTELPWVKAGYEYSVGGSFDCSNNQLTTLEGSPNSVGGSFNCSNNQLTSLEGSPNSVGGNFYCHNNKKKFTKEEVREICDVKGIINT